MEIPVDAPVQCADGLIGKSTKIILNPLSEKASYVVVRLDAAPHDELRVPVRHIESSDHDHIQLKCTLSEVESMEPFMQEELIRVEVPHYVSGAAMAQPFVYPEIEYRLQKYQRIPQGEIAVRRGAHVEASDGHVGRVDEFLVDPEDDQITHLVMHEGHLWGHTDVSIPISAIKRIGEKAVHLKLTKAEVKQLPSIPMRRRMW